MLKLKMNNSVSLVTNSWPKSSPAAFFISEPSGCFGDRKLWLRSRRRVPAAIWQSEFPIQNLQFGEFTSHVWSLFIVCWGEKWENQQKMQLILYIYIYYMHMVIFTSIYHLPGKAMIFQQPENRQSPGRQSCDWSTHHLASWKLGGCTRICQIRYQNSLTTASFFLGDLKLSCSPTWHLEFRCNLTWAFACVWGTDLALNKNR